MQSGMSVDVEVDRLSSLPDDLIYKILSDVNIADCIKLNVLSSRWRFIWTTIPNLNFENPNYEFVDKVLSARNNKTDESSLSLRFGYAWSRRVSEYRLQEYEFFQNLTTLHLHDITLGSTTPNLSMCRNLKNLTLEQCGVYESRDSGRFTITNPRLLSLTLKKIHWLVDFVYVGTPQLKNLIFVDKNNHSEEEEEVYFDEGNIRQFYGELTISASDLTYLRVEGYYFPMLCLGGFPSLEKVDLCISSPQKTDVHKINDMFQRLHSVKSLSLNLEILELLSTSEEVISHQPSPFTSVKRLKMYPLKGLRTWTSWDLETDPLTSCLHMFPQKLKQEQKAMTLKLSVGVANYLLDSSSNATFTMVSYEEARVIKITKMAYRLMTALRRTLEEMEANYTEIKRANVEWKKTLADSCRVDFRLNVWPTFGNTDVIFCLLKNIKLLLTKVVASKRVEMQSCFSRLSAKSKTVVETMVTDVTNQWVIKQRNFNGYFEEIDSSS